MNASKNRCHLVEAIRLFSGCLFVSKSAGLQRLSAASLQVDAACVCPGINRDLSLLRGRLLLILANQRDSSPHLHPDMGPV